MSEERADRAFARFLGIEVELLQKAGLHVTAHARLAGWNGAWLFEKGDARVLSVPAERAEPLRRRLRLLASVDSGAHALVERAFSESEVASVVGPSFWARLEPERFRPSIDDRVEPLGADDEPDLRALHERCGPADRAAYGHAVEDRGQFGLRVGGGLVAVAGWRDWGDGAGDPGILTAPEGRGRGLGRAVLSAVLEDALARDQTALYQTLRSNQPAVRVARALGFTEYATHLAVHLR